MPTQIQGIEFEVIGSGASEAAQSLDALTASLKKLKGVAGTKIGISSIAKEAREATKGGSASLKKFADGIEAIATAAGKLAGANSGLKSFAESISTLSSAKASAKTWDNISIGISKVGIAASAITPQALDKLDHMADALAKLSGVDLKGLGSALSGVRTNGKTTATPTPLPQDFQDAISAGDKLDMLRLKVITLRDALQTAFNKGDLTGAIRIREQILSVEEAIQKLEDKANAPSPALEALKAKLASVGKTALKAGMNLLAIPFKQMASNVRGLSDRFKNLSSSLKRIAFYRFIRTVIKEITQGLQEGIKNLYGWSKAFGGAIMNGKNFADTMDGIATSSLYLKNSLGAMVAPIISALAPAIDFIIDKVVALINVVNQLFALLGGATSWNKAIRKATEYEEATGGAGQAAKDAIHYLAPFDELNVLPDNKDRGGGGGGGTDFSGMFEEETEFLQGLQSFTNVVKRLIEEGDWERLGTLLGNKINELIDKIDFAGLGAKIGEKINAWFTTKYWTLETINFHAIGQNIATFLNNMLYEIDFDTLGRTITQPFTNLGDLIIGALSTADWSRVGSSIKGFITGAFKQMSDFLDKYDWTEVGTKLFEGLNEFISGLDPLAVLSGLVEFAGKLASAIYQIIQGFLLGNKTFMDESGVEWKFDVNGRLVKIEDKVPKSQKEIKDLKGKLNQLEDETTETDKIVEVDGKIINVTDSTHRATVIAAVAEIIEAYDNTLRDPLVGAIASLQRWEKAKGFDSTISDMAAEFIKWGVTAGFGRQIKDMVAVFSKWTKDNPQVFNQITDLVAKFKTWKKENGFPDTINGIIAGFTSWVKNNPQVFSQISGMIANLASWAKANGFSDVITGFTAALTSYLKQFDDPTLNAIAAIISAVDWTEDDLTLDAIAQIIKANPKLKENPTIYGILDYIEYLGIPDSITTPGYIDYDDPGYGTYIDPGAPVHDDPHGRSGHQDRLANGGVFSGGFWHDIPQFANGGVSHGSMFVAGEAGPELIGHIGGRTEVLNRSQIAATMYASMNSALRSSEPNEGVSEDAMYRAFRRALDETDFGGDIELDGDTLYSAMVTRNNRNTRMTGVNAFA